MYSQQDLDEAVASGVISADAAASLRNFVDVQRTSPSVDEEQFRLITSFNDIFVSIASAILLFAVGWIGQSIGQAIGCSPVEPGGPSALAPAAIAATAWGLALFFTARRRMALPSILLLLAFVGGVFATALFTLVDRGRGPSRSTTMSRSARSWPPARQRSPRAAAWLHWRRFHVPITVAAGAARRLPACSSRCSCRRSAVSTSRR